MKPRIIAIGTLLLAGLLPSLCAAQGPHPSTRQGWLVGFSVGGGSAGISTDSGREGGFAGSFRFGYALQPQLSMELNSNGWTKESNGNTITFGTVTAALNFYPGASGFLVRGGLGWGSATATAQSGNVTISSTETGFGLTAGAAYEFRVTRTFSIGPQVDYGWFTVDSFDGDYVTGSLGFTWYFIPRV